MINSVRSYFFSLAEWLQLMLLHIDAAILQKGNPFLS